MSTFTLAIHLLFDHFQYALIHGPKIPGSYAILLFIASNLASITSPIYNWGVVFALAASLHQKTKIMASGPNTSWEIDEETVETVSDFILGGTKITADGDCSHEIKRHLLGRKVMTNLDSIFKAETLPCQQRSL